MPGCFHTEHAPEDVLQGARNTYGTWVFGGQLKGWVRGPAETIAQFLKVRYPQFRLPAWAVNRPRLSPPTCAGIRARRGCASLS